MASAPPPAVRSSLLHMLHMRGPGAQLRVPQTPVSSVHRAGEETVSMGTEPLWATSTLPPPIRATHRLRKRRPNETGGQAPRCPEYPSRGTCGAVLGQAVGPEDRPNRGGPRLPGALASGLRRRGTRGHGNARSASQAVLPLWPTRPQPRRRRGCRPSPLAREAGTPRPSTRGAGRCLTPHGSSDPPAHARLPEPPGNMSCPKAHGKGRDTQTPVPGPVSMCSSLPRRAMKQTA